MNKSEHHVIGFFCPVILAAYLRMECIRSSLTQVCGLNPVREIHFDFCVVPKSLYPRALTELKLVLHVCISSNVCYAAYFYYSFHEVSTMSYFYSLLDQSSHQRWHFCTSARNTMRKT